jgi:TetR/AcrR family transcriptional regulator, cholesterol catabolism regulator
MNIESIHAKRVLDAGNELFLKFGIKSVTMDDIAKHLTMSKKTIYRYFRDKDDVVLTLCQEQLKEHYVHFDRISKTATDPIDEMIQVAAHMHTIFTKMNPGFFYDLQKYHAEAWKEVVKFKNELCCVLLEANMQRGIEQGLYRTEINIKVLAKMRMEQVDMGFSPEAFPPDKFTMSEVQLELLGHFLHGITTIKGHKLINKYRQVTEEE